jgi:hypothetical protein
MSTILAVLPRCDWKPGMNMVRTETEGTSLLFNKVPEITIIFWVIKIMSTTVGETGADYLAVHVPHSLRRDKKLSGKSESFFNAQRASWQLGSTSHVRTAPAPCGKSAA